MKLNIKIEKINTGFGGYSDDANGIFTTAEDYAKLKENIEDVIDIQVKYLKELGKNTEATELANAEVIYQKEVNSEFFS